ncbi:MAG: hypothetical protein M0011_07995 [Elusimicrobia bacterium]|nr:hypothetical protein [Elusimicrobiota bacterium]
MPDKKTGIPKPEFHESKFTYNSEKDIYIRGAGEILGVRQHGDMDLKLADMGRDKEILEQALADRDAILAVDPDLRAPENMRLHRKLRDSYASRWNLIDLA